MKKYFSQRQIFLIIFSLLFVLSLPIGNRAPVQSIAYAAKDKPIRLTFVSEWPKGHTFGKIVVEHYIDLVEKKSQNKIKIKYEDAGRLVKFRDMLPACRSGVADIFTQISSYCSGEIPLLSIWLMPFLSNTIEDHVELC